MCPDRARQIEELFQAALEVQPGERRVFLSKACSDDQQLLEEVWSLVSLHEQPDDLLDTPAVVSFAGLDRSFSAEPLVGRKLGQYEILSLLGRGGMGEVYLAGDTKLRRRVALKLLSPYLASDKQWLMRLEQEAYTVSSLSHPNIIAIYDVGEVEGLSFIATEFVEGENLRSIISRGEMDLNRVLDIAIQIASALQSAHSAGIVHRDIKPENIMVRPDGYVKVLDFGLAKHAEAADIAGSASLGLLPRGAQTHHGLLMGTARYMSPEQAQGLKVDTRSDIFSLGIIIYEMIAGRAPFDGQNSSLVIASIVDQEPLPLTGRSPELMPDLQRLVDKALRKNKEERYQTVDELLFDLRRIRDEIDLKASKRTDLKKGHLFNLINGKVLAGSAVIALLFIIALIYWFRPSVHVNSAVIVHPVHWWNFDIANINVFDSGASSGPVIGQKGPDIKTYASGRIAGSCTIGGMALELSGEHGSFVNLGPTVGQFGKQDFTIAFWFKTTTTRGVGEVLSNRDSYSHANFFSIRFNNAVFPGGKLAVELDQDASGHNYLTLHSQTGIRDGIWHHIAVRRQGTNGELFVDGILVSRNETINRVGDGITDIQNGKDLMLGSSPLAQENPIGYHALSGFEGQIDELQIYDQYLSPSQINKIYLSGLDSDEDNICDDVDSCPHSDRKATVMIGSCDSGVPNNLLKDGCTINDRLSLCSSERGQTIGCVSRITETLIKSGALSNEEKQKVDQCAAH